MIAKISLEPASLSPLNHEKKLSQIKVRLQYVNDMFIHVFLVFKVKYIVSTNKNHIFNTFYQFIKSVDLMYKMTKK